MPKRRGKIWLLAILVVLMLLATGCIFGGAKFYNVVGTVTEEGTGVTLSGVTVEINTKKAMTNAHGQYSLEKISKGTVVLKVSLAGYKTVEKSVSLKKDQTIDVSLKTDAPLLNMEYLSVSSEGSPVQDGDTIEGTTITLEGDAFGLFGELVPQALQYQGSGMITAQALVNGETYPIAVYDDGYFWKGLPLHPGENIIQLRLWDRLGHGRTTPKMTVRVNIPRLDLRAILSWDTPETDVDLHMFKRLASESNTFNLYNWDRHVFYANSEPTDFGDDKENPFLDIDETDGYGPETIVLKEATPGDYHIWIHPYDLIGYPLTKASIRVILDGGTSNARERVFNVDLPEEMDYITPVYVTTVRVTDTGVKSFVQVESDFISMGTMSILGSKTGK